MDQTETGTGMAWWETIPEDLLSRESTTLHILFGPPGRGKSFGTFNMCMKEPLLSAFHYCEMTLNKNAEDPVQDFLDRIEQHRRSKQSRTEETRPMIVVLDGFSSMRDVARVIQGANPKDRFLVTANTLVADISWNALGRPVTIHMIG